MKNAFTLLELMLSMVLAVVIIGTLYAGFRAASLTVSVTERLALENRLIVAGIIAAVDEVDSWASLDRPDHTPLRTNPAGGFKVITPSHRTSAGDQSYAWGGTDWAQLPQPFTPLKASWPTSGAADTIAAGEDASGLALSGAYDPTWLVNDPRTWYRLDGANWMSDPASREDENPFGNDALFSGAQSGVRVESPLALTAPGVQGDTRWPIAHTWSARQTKGLSYGLGFYGLFSYLPANAFLDYYDIDNRAPGRGLSNGEVRLIYMGGLDPNSNINHFGQGAAGNQYQGMFRMPLGYGEGAFFSGAERAGTRSQWLFTNHLGISGYPPGADNATRQRQLFLHRKMSGSLGRESEAGTYSLLLTSLSLPADLIAQRPSHWPQVTAEVRRTMKWQAMLNACYVRIIDPINGRMTQLVFPVTGTTLRGARISRGLDAQ